MSAQFPLIKKYLPELEIITSHLYGNGVAFVFDVVKASDLEQSLKKATVVYGTKDKEAGYAHTDNSHGLFTHQGILLGYQPIEKPLEPVGKDEIVTFLNKMSGQSMKYPDAKEYERLIERIKKAGVK